MLVRLLDKLAIWWLLRDSLPRLRLDDNKYTIMLSKAYQNPGLRTYLDEREAYLINQGMERFINNKIEHARGYAGQLIEIRALRTKMRACYNYFIKEQKEKKEKSTPILRQRRHSQ